MFKEKVPQENQPFTCVILFHTTRLLAVFARCLLHSTTPIAPRLRMDHGVLPAVARTEACSGRHHETSCSDDKSSGLVGWFSKLEIMQLPV